MTEASLHQDLWLPDERLRFGAHGRSPGAARLCRGRDGADGADLVILNTCHIREKAAEKVFSELGTIRRLKAAKSSAGGRMIVAVAGCVAQAEGAEILRARAVRRPRVRPAEPIIGCRRWWRAPRAGSGAAFSTPSFPAEPKFDFLPESRRGARGHRVSDGAGRLRQVLHLLRRALYARRGIFAPGGARSSPRRAASSRRGARDHPARAERQRLSRRRVPTAASGASAS